MILDIFQYKVCLKSFGIYCETVPPLLKGAKYTTEKGLKLYCRWNAKLYKSNSNRNLLT